MSALTAAIKPVAFAAPVIARRYRSRSAVAMSLAGKHVVVTGASRGIGRGLAIALGEQRATVYITGRRPRGDSNSLEETAAMVRAAGGMCVPMVCDHADDADVKAFFADLSERLDAGAGGKLDAFVNNAYAAVPFLMASGDVPFWNKVCGARLFPHRGCCRCSSPVSAIAIALTASNLHLCQRTRARRTRPIPTRTRARHGTSSTT